MTCICRQFAIWKKSGREHFYAELSAWYQRSGLPLKKFFNTSGLMYKNLGLKDKLPCMSLEEQAALLATNGMLVKRPILIVNGRICVGFKADEWKAALHP